MPTEESDLSGSFLRAENQQRKAVNSALPVQGLAGLWMSRRHWWDLRILRRSARKSLPERRFEDCRPLQVTFRLLTISFADKMAVGRVLLLSLTSTSQFSLGRVVLSQSFLFAVLALAEQGPSSLWIFCSNSYITTADWIFSGQFDGSVNKDSGWSALW